MAALPAAATGMSCSSSSASQRGVDVAGAQRRGEALVGRTHRAQVGTGQPAHRLEHGQPVHRGDDRHRVRRRARVDAGDHGRATRHGGDQPRLLQPQQRLADGGAAHAEPGGELEVAQLLAGLEGAVDDRVAQPLVDVVAQQHALARRRPRWGTGMQYIVIPRERPASRPRSWWQRRAARAGGLPGQESNLRRTRIQSAVAPASRATREGRYGTRVGAAALRAVVARGPRAAVRPGAAHRPAPPRQDEGRDRRDRRDHARRARRPRPHDPRPTRPQRARASRAGAHERARAPRAARRRRRASCSPRRASRPSRSRRSPRRPASPSPSSTSTSAARTGCTPSSSTAR